jgi:hypothetical protein
MATFDLLTADSARSRRLRGRAAAIGLRAATAATY